MARDLLAPLQVSEGLKKRISDITLTKRPRVITTHHNLCVVETGRSSGFLTSPLSGSRQVLWIVPAQVPRKSGKATRETALSTTFFDLKRRKEAHNEKMLEMRLAGKSSCRYNV